MNHRILATVYLALVASVVSATPKGYRFEATIQIDQQQANQLSVELQPGQSRIINIRPGIQIEFIAPDQSSTEGPTIVRLLDVTGSRPVQLHEGKRFGSASVSRAFTYGICSGKVSFVSPSPKEPFACKP